MRLAVALLSIACTSCATDPSSTLTCEILRGPNGRAIVSDSAMRSAAALGLERSREALRRLPEGSWAVGFAGPIARRVPGSAAHDYAVDIRSLREHLARTKAMELAFFNDGSTLVGTSREWECSMLAGSVSSLNLVQSEQSFRESLSRVESYFGSTLNIFSSSEDVEQ